MARGKAKQAPTGKNGNGANLGFEAQLFLAGDKLRGNLEPSDYKHVVLGLIFLKYISDAFEAKHAALLAEDPDAAEDQDEYLAENVFWVPKDARWSYLQANAKQPIIGKLIDDAMLAIESSNASLKGVLPKDYNRPALNKIMLGELIDLISSTKKAARRGICSAVFMNISSAASRARKASVAGSSTRRARLSACWSNAGAFPESGERRRGPGL